MENRTINIGVVAEVAQALKDLKDQMVFVGGAVVSLYADDPAADEIRPTADIDMTLNVVNLSNWSVLQEKLASLGFHPDPFGHAICSYKFKDIPVDIMPAEDGPLGPANKWYKLGFDNLWTVKAKEEDIKILPAPCYLATKFEAFNNRGKDYRTSHDFEDIIYILDNRTSIVEEVKSTLPEIKSYLQSQLSKLEKSTNYDEFLSAHIHPLIIADRAPIVKGKITQIVSI
jgi:predicted nucleotidyltransferase